MSGGRVLFVGCGPGAADLLTVRAVRALETADVVIWNDAVLDRQALADHTRESAEIVQWPPATQQEILDAYDRARVEDLLVVRLKGGDPTLFGALEPELSAVRERGIECEIVPGVSALCASAAALGREIASSAAPLLLVDAASFAQGDRGAPAVAAHGAGRDPQALQRALLAHGLPRATRCTLAIEVARRDETLVECSLEDLGETVQDIGCGVLTLVIAGAPSVPAELPQMD